MSAKQYLITGAVILGSVILISNITALADMTGLTIKKR